MLILIVEITKFPFKSHPIVPLQIYIAVSQVLGFGLIDAHAMVNSGKTWSTVPPQQMCEQTKP